MKEQTDTLAQFIVDAGPDRFSKDLITASKLCFLDWFGVTLGGLHTPAVDILLSIASDVGGKPQASIVGYDRKTDRMNAALINGAMSHVLDFDDAHMWTRNHPGAPLIAALLAVAEHEKLSGSELVNAFILGFETGTRIGLALGKDYYDKGWHATPILGRFAVAAGVGRLLGLNSRELKNAFGLAATQAGGIRKSFGSMAKPFHAGEAAADGIFAAMLAQAGFSAAEDILDSRSGFLCMLSSRPNYDSITRKIGKVYHLHEVSFKPYAACLAIHPVIDGLIALRKESRLDPADIVRVDIQAAPICMVLGDNRDVRTGLKGKFSVYFCAALALAEGHANESAFTDQMVRKEKILKLMSKITVTEKASFQESEAIVKVENSRGHTWERHITAPKGDPRNPMNFGDVSEKFIDLTGNILSKENTERILQDIQDLENLNNIKTLMDVACKRIIIPENPDHNNKNQTLS